jgi:oxygen-independent coproporphyrinogen-3 oxidase
MSGIYVHIPFCKDACTYCNFHFTVSLNKIDTFHQALLNEIKSYRNNKDLINIEFDTIYFGGGTPSLLNHSQLYNIINEIKDCFPMSDDIKEITLEVNPDDFTTQKAKEWKAIGINRISLGIQSFNNNVLEAINRKHTTQQSLDALSGLLELGFELSIDLIYGLPLQSFEVWKQDLDLAMSFPINHLSAYSLTIEGHTLLHHQIAKNIVSTATDEEFCLMYNYLVDTTSLKEFEHYEICSFARSQKYAIHNSNYWNYSPYVGLGPSAHSFLLPNKRFANKSSNSAYINKFLHNKDIKIQTIELLNDKDIKKERILLGLRNAKGLNLDVFSQNETGRILKAMSNYSQDNYSIINNFVVLSPKGKFISDNIISTLFECI